MAASFLHGVEVIEINVGPLPVTVVPSAVIGLVGSAPMWAASGAIPRWDYNAKYAVGNQILDSNGNIQQVTVAGTSGVSAEPTWATTIGATTASDGTVTWKLVTLGLVGAVPGQAANIVNMPTLVGSGQQAAAFGPMIQGYSVPYALNAILQQAGGQIVVVNIFDQTKHITTVAPSAFSMPASGAQVISLGRMGISAVKVTNSGATITYVQGTDFTVDHVNGLITQIGGGAITVGEALEIGFAYADPSKIADADVVGTVSSGNYTGIQALATTYGAMGFFPKILIAPAAPVTISIAQTVGSSDAAISAALLAMANKIRAMALIDSLPQVQIATAVSNRSLSGNPFDNSSSRYVLCYPNELFTDLGLVPTGVTVSAAGTAVQQVSGAVADGPFSPWVAGAMSARDLAQGYWWSVSNMQITGILGPDVTLYASILDPSSDVNTLNAAGIVTVFNSFGTGLRVWGNRSAAYPSSTAPDNFIPVRRTMDVLEESVERAMMQFLDQPISNALITAVLASVNAFIRSLIQRGALVAGKATYNPADNPPASIAAGQIVFEMDVMPPPPAERITWQTFIDTTLLSSLGNTTAAAA